MKDIETAIQDELTKTGKKAEEVVELVLDNKCKASIIKGVREFSELELLSLGNLGITSLEAFPHLPKLRRLILSDNKISGGLKALVDANLTALKELNLANNRITNLDDLKPLASLKLESLDLFSCPVEKSCTDFHQAVFNMFDELKYLDDFDKMGHDRDGDDEEEEEYDDEEGEGGEEEYEEGADDDGEEEEGEEEGDFEEGGEDDDDEEGDDESAGVGTEQLLAENVSPEEDDDYEDEDDAEEEEGEEEEDEEEDDDDDDEDEEEAGPSGGSKRKRAEEEEEEEEDEDDEE